MREAGGVFRETRGGGRGLWEGAREGENGGRVMDGGLPRLRYGAICSSESSNLLWAKEMPGSAASKELPP